MIGPGTGGSEERKGLEDLNVRIGEAESAGDLGYLNRIVAVRLAFRRADGSCVDRGEFLKAVKPSAPRRTEVESIDFLGASRAIVKCIVTVEPDTAPRRFHNVRVFIRDTDGQWKILAWANEPA